MTDGWELFPHDADIGVRGFGDTLAVAFEQTALALTAVITPPESVRAEREVSVTCEAEDPEILLLDWLNALIFETSTHQLLFARSSVTIEPMPAGMGLRLRGRAWGEEVDRERHHPAVEVKGATFTQLEVREEGGRWRAQCVVDV